MSSAKVKIQAVLFVAVLVCASLALLLTFTSIPSAGKYTYTLNTFTSYDELRNFLRERSTSYGGGPMAYTMNDVKGAATDSGRESQAPSSSPSGGQSADHSSTNVQVAGVDEPDTVKTDGSYIYTISNNSLVIVRAYPAEQAGVTARITFDMNDSIQSFFLNDDRLIVFCGGYGYPILYGEGIAADIMMPRWGAGEMSVKVYDISDRASPAIIKTIKLEGSFTDARMIDSYIYVVATTPTYTIYNTYDGNATLKVPTVTVDDQTTTIAADDIYYVDVPDLADSMTHVLSLNIDTMDLNEKSFMLGQGQTMYVSQNNIFLATTHSEPIETFAPQPGGYDYKETTILHKIAINQSSIDYVAQGEVPGHILNQFAMDEYHGSFRIATTESSYNDGNYQSTNNVYVLDGNLKRIGSLQDLAPGESIYAVRFLGDRAYLVTFVQVDPLFVIDLSDPTNPSVLGELKIPGYSTYLHPYDADHIIGIGREVDPSIDADLVHTPGAIYYTAIQGLKLALFDVTDVTNPLELESITIGDRGTDSPALYDHKAFLFDKDKGLLVIPVNLYEIPQQKLDTLNDTNGTDNFIDWNWGQNTFQGAYVYHLTLDGGFRLQGRITHRDDNQPQDFYGYWGSYSTDITRSLYIGNILYTISQNKIKANSLEGDLQELASITLA
jgi:inhibitor of cysteine peptidase